MDLGLDAPDHTTLSRRSKGLNAKLIPIASKEQIYLIIDSTGLSIVGEDEWATVKDGGRMRWKKESGYHRQGVVENALFHYKAMLGDQLYARGLAAQKTEVAIGCKIMNRLLVLGRPRSVAIVL